MTFVNAQTNRAESNVDDRSNALVGCKYTIKQDESGIWSVSVPLVRCTPLPKAANRVWACSG